MILFVCGTFDQHRGKFSKIGHEIYQGLAPSGGVYMNGGNFDQLRDLFSLRNMERYDVIYWFANVSNDADKIVRKIKVYAPKAILVTSKRNVEKEYCFAEIIQHALGLKSNLVVEFTKKEEKYRGRIIDPLGCLWLDYTDNMPLLGSWLWRLTDRLKKFTRLASVRDGDSRGLDVPNDEEFFALVKRYADMFHSLIHVSHGATERFLGNASFRCTHGFPSFRKDDTMFVSRRNIDKRGINQDAFVGVGIPNCSVSALRHIGYVGDFKPSVDAPIQAMLYNILSGVKYMLHAHVYIDGAPFTEEAVPCGAMEEVHSILRAPVTDDSGRINLRGHGSIVLAKSLKDLEDIPYVPRHVPEHVTWRG